MTRKPVNKTKISKSLFILWSLIILILSVIPSVESPLPKITFLDKIAHLGQYLIFALLYYLMRLHQKKRIDKIVKELIILSLILPILNELIQIPIPGRNFSLLDIGANFIGFLVVIIFLKIKEKELSSNEKRR